MIVRCRIAGLVAAVVGWVVPLSAQGGAATIFVPGSLSEQVVSVRDPRQRYAVYVPSGYDSLRPRPLLCLMDPRGRALIPLQLLRPAAERIGYIVFSSYDTRSDEPDDPNEAAVNAMIADAQRLFVIAYLEQRGIRHHVASYDGPHGWPPESVMSDGLQWMELQAMRRGLIPLDSAWIDSVYRVRSASAAAADSSGDGYMAWLEYHAVRADFAGLHDVGADSGRVFSLERTAKVRRALEHRAEIAERHRAHLVTLRRFIARTRERHEKQKLSQSLKELQIMRLKHQAADTSDRFSALGAAQLLQQVFVVTAFYEPREALAGKNPARALGLLDIAEEIHPGTPFVCASRKEVLGRLGRAAEADAVRCPSSRD